MTRRAFVLGSLLVLLAVPAAYAVPPTAGPYDPKADAQAQLAAAGQRAAASGKRVLAVVGGNWCGWCRALDRLMNEDPRLKAAVAAFEVVHVNVSKDNKNEAAMAKLGRPDKLGFPSLVVLSPKLDVLTTQGTEGFELADKKHPGHDPAKLATFLDSWRAKGA